MSDEDQPDVATVPEETAALRESALEIIKTAAEVATAYAAVKAISKPPPPPPPPPSPQATEE